MAEILDSLCFHTAKAIYVIIPPISHNIDSVMFRLSIYFDYIKQYIEYYRPDFIINSAIATIDSDPQMAYEINYLGSIP